MKFASYIDTVLNMASSTPGSMYLYKVSNTDKYETVNRLYIVLWGLYQAVTTHK